jgi:hypothetical protein
MARWIPRPGRPSIIHSTRIHDTYFSLIVRTSQNEKSLLPTLVAAIHEIDPGIGTMNETTMAGPNQRIADCLSPPFLGLAGGWLRFPRIAAGSGRPLWSDCLLGEPADARNRSSHGARRATQLGVSAHHERGGLAGGRGNCRGPSLLDRRRNVDSRPAVWSSNLGRGHAGRSVRRPRDRGHAGELHSGTPCGACRSHGGAAVRMKEDGRNVHQPDAGSPLRSAAVA